MKCFADLDKKLIRMEAKIWRRLKIEELTKRKMTDAEKAFVEREFENFGEETI